MQPDVSRYCALVINRARPVRLLEDADAVLAVLHNWWATEDAIRAAAETASTLADVPEWLFTLGTCVGDP